MNHDYGKAMVIYGYTYPVIIWKAMATYRHDGLFFLNGEGFFLNGGG